MQTYLSKVSAGTHREVINLVDTKWLTSSIPLSQIYVAIAGLLQKCAP